jgi:hypothetical protein
MCTIRYGFSFFWDTFFGLLNISVFLWQNKSQLSSRTHLYDLIRVCSYHPTISHVSVQCGGQGAGDPVWLYGLSMYTTR